MGRRERRHVLMRRSTVTHPEVLAKMGYRIRKGRYGIGLTGFERFIMCLRADHSGCILWTGPRFANGYGRVTTRGKNFNAHRMMYYLTRGPIADGFVIDHLCRQKLCVNPLHFDVVTPGENVLRGDSPGARNRRMTTCKNGHAFSHVTARGRRRCRPCDRAYSAA